MTTTVRGVDDWDRLAGWWRAEVAADPAYGGQVLPLLAEALAPEGGSRYLDLGCGEGQGMRAIGGRVVGCDLSHDLLRSARAAGPVVRCRLPDGLACFRSGAFDGAYAVLVLEHLDDLGGFFAAARRVVRYQGTLAVVANHPTFLAPGAGPLVDPTDGEVLWRWGAYLRSGTTQEPAGDRTVTFHHRPLGHLLTAAGRAGWSLRWLAERPAESDDPLLAAQRHVPRLLAARWVITD